MTNCLVCNLTAGSKIKANYATLSLLANEHTGEKLKQSIVRTAEPDLLQAVAITCKNYLHKNVKFDEFDEKLLKKRFDLVKELSNYSEGVDYHNLVRKTFSDFRRLIPHIIAQFLKYWDKAKYHELDKI